MLRIYLRHLRGRNTGIKALHFSSSTFLQEEEEEASSSISQSPKPGSAADLLNFLKTHEAKWTLPRKQWSHRSKTQPKHHISKEDLDHRQRLRTLQVTEAFTKAESKLAQDGLSQEQKLQIAQECIDKLCKISQSSQLSLINLAVMLHRTARLIDHPALKRNTASSIMNTTVMHNDDSIVAVKSIPPGNDFGQNQLMHKLIARVVNRYKLDNHDSSTSTSSTSSPSLLPTRAIECSAAVTALFACSIAHIIPSSPDDLDILISAIYNDKANWNHRQVVMIAVSLGRLQMIPFNGVFHNALKEAVNDKLMKFPPSELCTVLRGMAQAGFDPGKPWIHSILIALQPHIPSLYLNDVLQVLYSLSQFSYSPQCGLPQNIRSKKNATSNTTTTATAKSISTMTTGQKGSHSSFFPNKNKNQSTSPIASTTATQQTSLQFRDLRELQELARDYENRRRQQLDSWQKQQVESATPDLNTITARVAHVRRERTLAVALAKETDSLVKNILAMMDKDNATTIDVNNNNTTNNNNESGNEDDDGDVDVDVLMHRILTGTWPSLEINTNSTSDYHIDDNITLSSFTSHTNYNNSNDKEQNSGVTDKNHQSSGKGRRIVRLGRLLAEARYIPESGRTIIEPHYDASILWDDCDAVNMKFYPVLNHSTIDADGLDDFNNKNDANDRGNSLKRGGSVEQISQTILSTTGNDTKGMMDFEQALPINAGEIAAETIRAMLLHALDRIPSEQPEALLQIPWFMGVLRHWDEDILGRIVHGLENMPQKMLTNVAHIALAEFLWGFASLGAKVPSYLVDKMMNILLSEPQNANPPAMYCKLAWTLAGLNALTPSLFEQLCSKFETSLKTYYKTHKDTKENKYMDYMQLYQAALQLEVDTKKHHSEFLPENIRQAGSAAWKTRDERVKTSKMQLHVASVLNDLGVTCHLEYAPPESNVVIDIAVTHPSSNAKIAVEVDGPFHFAANEPMHMLGPVKLRNSLLEHHGWKVVSVPFYEWGVLTNNDEEKSYLTRRVISLLK